MRIAEGQQIGSEAIDLVAKENADGKTRLPVEQVDGMDAGLDSRDLVVPLPQILDQRGRIGRVVPRDGLLGAERCLGDGAFGRTAGDATEVKFFAACAIGGPEKRSDVVHATDVIEQDRNRDSAEIRGE